MTTLRIGIVSLLISFVAVSLHAADPKEVNVEQTWDGKNADTKLKQEAPKEGFLTDGKSFEKLWKSWRGEEKVPMVDFTKELAIVLTCDGPNRMMFPKTVKVDDKGNLKLPPAASTRIGGEGFGYKIVTIKRDGIKSINGKEIKDAQ
jgi:hypothetical protein